MAYTDFICLAASLRPGGMCYAGKEVATRRWVRPMRSAETHSIPHYHKVYGPNDPAKIGDIIRCPNIGHLPTDWQTENFVRGSARWTKVGSFDFAAASGLIDHPSDIWATGEHSSQGVNDKVRVTDASKYTNSLLLVSVQALAISAEDNGFGKLKHRTEFQYRGKTYNLAMTDPHMNLEKAGAKHFENALVCCSLPERWKNEDGTEDPYIYKVAAGIITQERLG